MAFSNYREIGQVQQEFNIKHFEVGFVPAQRVEPSVFFLQEFEFTRARIDFEASEAARTEAIIFPILREVYKDYHERFALWIQKPIIVDARLNGTPDYLIAVRSPLGKKVLAKPLAAVVEAKKNDFEYGWGQCLAELVAAQKLNEVENFTVFGIVTDGERWEIGKLQADVFTQESETFTIADLPRLFGALHFVFQSIGEQLNDPSLISPSHLSL